MMLVRFATEPAPGQAQNEDGVLRCGNLVGVFDGVSQPAGIKSGCVHGIPWYVEKLTSRLAEVADSRPDESLVNLLASAIAVVADDHDGKCDLTNPATPAATATLVREQGNRLEYLVLCDGLLVVDDGDEVSLITDLRFERAVAGIRRDHLTREEAIDSPEHAARVLDAVLRKQQLTNTPAGYWIAAANPEAASHAVTGALPLTGHKAIRRAALLTDGASRAVDLFGMFDWRHMLDLLEANDPQTLIHLVREAERADHDGRDKPRFKRHDDATVAMVTFSTKGN